MNALITAAKQLRDACAESNGDFIHRETLKDLFAGLREVEKSNLTVTAYTEKQAAEILQCSPRTLYDRRATGELKEGFHYSYITGRPLYAPIHLARIIEGQQPERNTPHVLTSKNSTHTQRGSSNPGSEKRADQRVA